MPTGKIRTAVAAFLFLGLTACGGATGSNAGRITDRLQLETTRAVAGTPIKGVFIVDNPNRSVNLNHRCRPGFAVTLTNATFPPGAAFDLPCDSEPFVLAHGTNRYPFTVSTDYPRCIQPGGGPITATSPACNGGNKIPPLPPGSYQAVFDNDGLTLPTPSRVAVTLTADRPVGYRLPGAPRQSLAVTSTRRSANFFWAASRRDGTCSVGTSTGA